MVAWSWGAHYTHVRTWALKHRHIIVCEWDAISLFFAVGRRRAGCRRFTRRWLTWPLVPSTLLLFDYPSPPRVPAEAAFPGLIANSWRTVVHASVTFDDTWKCSAYTRENVSLNKQYFENRMWDKQKRERTFNSIIEYLIIVYAKWLCPRISGAVFRYSAMPPVQRHS